jgi:probable HAF family extracellular repeat protein
VVGDSDTADGEFRAFLWEGGAMTDLNDLLPAGFTVTLTSAGGINDAGQIIAHGGDDRAYLLTPTNVAAVPEPASAVMLAAGAVGLAAFRQRLRRA